jgi:anti-sigma regulatory factor (Ser/Thr protein kinase)
VVPKKKDPAGWDPDESPDKPLRKRFTRTVLIPALAFLAIVGIVTPWPLYNAVYALGVAGSVQNVSIPAVKALASAQRERELSLTTLVRAGAGVSDLYTQQQTTDQALAAMRTAIGPILQQAPPDIAQRIQALNGLLDQLPARRAQVLAGTTTVDQVNRFYNSVLDAATSLFDAQARFVPDVATTQGAITGTFIFRASDHLSRESSLVTVGLATGAMPSATHLEFTGLVGSYRRELDSNGPFLQPDVRARYEQLTRSDTWARLQDAENTIIEHGAWNRNNLPPVALTDWQTETTVVSQQLTDLVSQQAIEVADIAVANAYRQLFLVAAASVGAILIAIASWVIARRVSTSLVQHTLVARLRQLREQAVDLAEKRLPALVQSIQNGEPVDVQAQLPPLDHGRDEIGQLGAAFNVSQQTAVQAALAQARQGVAVQNVFGNFAHRNELLSRNQIRRLLVLEQDERDPDRVKHLFRVHHEAVQVRRNAENIKVLGGGKVGRTWRQPASFVDVVRAAKAETAQYEESDTPDYSRITIERLPEVGLVNTAIADTTHLLAELLDNALKFSGTSPVAVSGRTVANGATIEIDDQGVGMTEEDLDQFNHWMQEPPGFEVITDQEEWRLGLLVVARLAKRQGIQVTLDHSRWGGVGVTVRIPGSLVAQGGPGQAADAVAAQSNGQHRADEAAMAGQPLQVTGEIPLVWGRDTEMTGSIEPEAVGNADALPKRVRDANMAPQLWQHPEEQVEADQPAQNLADSLMGFVARSQREDDS